MRDPADVSVIIPAYRAAATIARALAGVAAQTLLPREVVVVIDGPDDAAYQTAAAMTENMNGVALKILDQPHQGAGAARNRAIQEASGRYLAFLDADDEWLPEKLARSMAHLQGTDNLLVAHDYYRREDDGTEKLVDCARRFRDGGDPFASLYRRGYIATCTVVARRDAVLAAGGFDAGLPTAQDFDLWLSMLAGGGRFEVFAEALSRYYPMPGSITSHTRRRLRCCLTIALRHFPDLRTRSGSALAGSALAGSALASLWFRIAAVHHEAVAAYRQRGNVGAMLGTVLAFPFNLAGTTVAVHAGAAMWLWVITAMAAYLIQFRHFIGPIRRVLGIG